MLFQRHIRSHQRKVYIVGIHSWVKLWSFRKSTHRCTGFIMTCFKGMENGAVFWVPVLNLESLVMYISWLLDQNIFDMTMALPPKGSSIKTFKRLIVCGIQEVLFAISLCSTDLNANFPLPDLQVRIDHQHQHRTPNTFVVSQIPKNLVISWDVKPSNSTKWKFVYYRYPRANAILDIKSILSFSHVG